MHAMTVTARAPQARFRDANDSGFPVVPTNFQPSAPCSPGQECCDDCSQAPARYLASDIEARPRIPSAFRRGMQGLGVSSNAYLAPFVPGSWSPQAAARRLPGVGPEESRPEGFHGLGANVAIAAPDPRIVAASNFLARSGFGNAELNAAGLHRYQVISSAGHILQTVTFGGFDRSTINDYARSVCSMDDAGNIVPGSGDVTRGRAIVNTIVRGASALVDAIPGAEADKVAAALRLIADQVGELENEIRQRCENVAAARRRLTEGGGVDYNAVAREIIRRHGARGLVTATTGETKAMGTGTKVLLAAGALGILGAVVFAIAK